MTRLVLAIAALFMLVVPAGAERLVSTLSSQQVLITSSFDGAVLSLFGNIEGDTDGTSATGPYNVVIVIEGPRQDRVTRLKTSNFGIWSNTDQVIFRHFPSFYAVVSSGRIENIVEPEMLRQFTIAPEDQARAAAQSTGLKGETFALELVRLMKEEKHIVVRDDGIRFLSPTAYSLNITLPSDVANGPFAVHTFVFKDKQLVADRTEGFSVRKSGFENFLYVASRQQSLLYGLACVLLALTTGWLAGVVFRR